VSARLDHYLRNNIRTYRHVFIDDTGSTSGGVLFQLTGAAGKKVSLRHIQMSNPNVGFNPFLVERLSTLCSTGTPVALSPVPISNPNGSSAGAALSQYSALAPTKGTLIGAIHNIDLSTSIVMNEHYGDEDGGNSVTMEDSTHAVAISITTTGIIVNGYIEWTEEPGA